jgi:hypothetical protein
VLQKCATRAFREKWVTAFRREVRSFKDEEQFPAVCAAPCVWKWKASEGRFLVSCSDAGFRRFAKLCMAYNPHAIYAVSGLENSTYLSYI